MAAPLERRDRPFQPLDVLTSDSRAHAISLLRQLES